MRWLEISNMRRPLLGLEADHLADHLHRDLGGDLLDELALARSITSSTTVAARLVDVARRSWAIIRGREALGHQPAAGVLRRIHVQDRQADLGEHLLVLGRG